MIKIMNKRKIEKIQKKLIKQILQKIAVRIMSRASHRDTGKRRVNQVNENSKLKSEICQDAKTICTEERKALSSIES